jgi:hypothetical protein
MNIIQTYEAEEIARLTAARAGPIFGRRTVIISSAWAR